MLETVLGTPGIKGNMSETVPGPRRQSGHAGGCPRFTRLQTEHLYLYLYLYLYLTTKQAEPSDR